MSEGTLHRFYNSKAWKRASQAYMKSKHYICERCGQPAAVCHHRSYLNEANYTDPAISLNFDNLECLCMACHNDEHFSEKPERCIIFDNTGNIQNIIEKTLM